ncbi:hypothetical protein VTN77DRAFT_6009 [Rasamsonia byssochlamydoides]|uniref:uncharacterized protein n=1 Tax=Rasamsonia byssochlamydoides TaxID=89139 RepID=UPI003742B411
MGATRTATSSNRQSAMTKSSSAPTSSNILVENVSASRKRSSNEQSGSSKRRRTDAGNPSKPIEVIDLTDDSVTTTPTKNKAKRTPSSKETPERRARMFRRKPPQSYLEKLARATTQRMFVIGRTRTGTDENPEEIVHMVGTTGNVYTVTISKEPTCTCPDALKGNQCKHVIYVLVNVLKASPHLRYQLAFLTSELREMFENAPISPQGTGSNDDTSGKRKPVEGDCPICFMEFDPETEEIVWCKTACGNNVHKACFDRWAASTRENGVRCVYCRSPWPSDGVSLDVESLVKKGHVNHEGYINVASSVGLSGIRDYSTYHQPWVRRRYYRYWH